MPKPLWLLRATGDSPSRQARRNGTPPPTESGPAGVTLPGRALTWLWPWRRKDYPGQYAGYRATLGNLAALDTIRDWRRGRHPMPVWAARSLADQIHARSLAGLALAGELLTYAEQMEQQRSPRAIAAPLLAYMARKQGTQAPPIA